MIPPQELKNKSFTRSGKGYDIAEVDEYLDFIIEKYSEIFAQCDKYDKKLRIVSSRISEIQSEEETIHKLVISTQRSCDRLLAEAEEEAKNKILNAQQTAERILAEAKEKAQAALSSIERKAAMQIEATQQKSDALLLSARTRCTKLLSDFKKEIAIQRENIQTIKTVSEEFNTQLLTMYKNHLSLLNENTYTPIIDLEGFTESKLFESVMQEIKADAAEIAQKYAGVEYDFEKELKLLNESLDSVAGMSEPGGRSRTARDTNDTDDYNYDDDDSDVKIAGNNYNSYERASAVNNDTADDDEDVKVFSKARASEPYAGGAQREDNIYDEKPMATYDSDDYEYGGGDSDEKYASGSGDDDYGDMDYDEDDYADSDDSEEDIYEYENDADDSKGFFGLFKNKKRERRPDRRYDPDYDDDDEIEDEVLDMFEDLDDEE